MDRGLNEMERILFLAHTASEGGLPKAALEALAVTLELANGLGEAGLTVGLFGSEVAAAADAVAGCGAERILGVAGAEYGVPRYSTDAAAADALVRVSGADIVVAPTTSRLARALPGVAQRVGGRIDTRVTGLAAEGGPRIERWYYRRRMLARMRREGRPWFIVVESGVYDPWQGAPGSGSVELLRPEPPTIRTRVEGEEAATAGAQTIRPDADLLFVAGAGWTKNQADGEIHAKRAEELISSFLERTGASLGGSKSLVDQSGEGERVLSFMSHLNQVGQTGSTPRHPKGLATCCHGEEPHVVGWRFIEERRAVNLDPNCGWAQGKADVLYVADAFEVMGRLNEILEGE